MEALVGNLNRVSSQLPARLDLEDASDKICRGLLQSSAALDGLPRELSAAAGAVLAEHAANGGTVERLDALLRPSCGALGDALVGAYRTHADRLRAVLATVGWRPPHIGDVDWKLSVDSLNSVSGATKEAVYTIELNSRPSDAQPSILQFQCSFAQLQDLLWKAKEALKAVEKASKFDVQ